MGLRRLCRQLVDYPWFEKTIILLIIFNAIILGLETFAAIAARYGDLMHTLNKIILGVFVLEALVKITSVAPRYGRYFGNGWNLFDFSVVVLSLVPASGEYATIARMARLLRVMRLVSTLPELRLIVATLVRSIPGMANVILLLMIVFYMYAIAGFHLFHEHDPTHWGSLGLSLLTLFRVLTLEDWTDVMYTAMELNDSAWIFFVSFVVVATFVVINLFIAVVINNLEEAKKEHAAEDLGNPNEEPVLAQIKTLRQSLSALEAHLEQTSTEKPGRPRT
ncbi:MAG: ion transporter [Gammaproteobacteria bacterium]|nr:ion transporter [Gammaproteobacteria bacterium]